MKEEPHWPHHQDNRDHQKTTNRYREKPIFRAHEPFPAPPCVSLLISSESSSSLETKTKNNQSIKKTNSKASIEREREREPTSAIGSDEKASIAGMESEAEVLNERSWTRRRMAVDARVCESQIFDHNRCISTWIAIGTHLNQPSMKQKIQIEIAFTLSLSLCVRLW